MGKKWKFGVKLMQFFVLMQYDLYSCVIFAIQNVLILIEVNCLCFLIYEHSQVNIYIYIYSRESVAKPLWISIHA